MKIVHINFSSDSGGAAIAVRRIHDLLCSEQIDSNLLVCESNIEDDKIIKIKKTSENIKTQIKKTISRKLKIFFKTQNKNTHSINMIPSNLIKIVNDLNPDYVNLHWIGNETISISDIKKIKSKIIWTLHDMWPFCGAEHYTNNSRYIDGYLKSNRPSSERGFDLNKFIWEKKIKNFKNIDKIICSSQWLFDCAKKSYLFKEKKIKQIPLPIDTSFWTPTDKFFSKQFFGIKANEKVILFGADNFIKNERKGFNRISSLLKKIKVNGDYKIIFFGVNKSYKFKDINKNIINLGNIRDEYTLKLIYSAADVTLVPSLVEAFGLTAYESIHCGTPCVIFDGSGLSSIIEHKKNGYIAKKDLLDDFLKGIHWCLENSSIKQKVISNITKIKFNKKEIIKNYISFLNS